MNNNAERSSEEAGAAQPIDYGRDCNGKASMWTTVEFHFTKYN